MNTTDLRSYYARLIAGKADTSNARLISAFAAIERERFVGRGPWKIMAHASGYLDTPSDDLAFLYQDVVVALDADRGINNGEPSLHARSLAALDVRDGELAIHIGSGTGYYTAILAHLVGAPGAIIAYEIDQELARRAGDNLKDWPHVSVRDQSGTVAALPACDIIYVSAGATRPIDAWLDALQPHGRLLFPLTPGRGLGGMLLVTHRAGGASFDARFVSPATFIPCAGARDGAEAALLGEAFGRRDMDNVKSLHRGSRPDDSCWFTGHGWWLSTRATTET